MVRTIMTARLPRLHETALFSRAVFSLDRYQGCLGARRFLLFRGGAGYDHQTNPIYWDWVKEKLSAYNFLIIIMIRAPAICHRQIVGFFFSTENWIVRLLGENKNVFASLDFPNRTYPPQCRSPPLVLHFRTKKS